MVFLSVLGAIRPIRFAPSMSKMPSMELITLEDTDMWVLVEVATDQPQPVGNVPLESIELNVNWPTPPVSIPVSSPLPAAFLPQPAVTVAADVGYEADISDYSDEDGIAASVETVRDEKASPDSSTSSSPLPNTPTPTTTADLAPIGPDLIIFLPARHNHLNIGSWIDEAIATNLAMFDASFPHVPLEVYFPDEQH